MVFSNKRLDLDGLKPTINSIPIEKQVVSRFLGVLIDNKLSWKQHITALSKKLNQNAGILIKVKGIFPLPVLKILYHSFIQSHLNYCPLIWGLGSKSSLNTSFVAQKKSLHVIAPGFVRFWYDKKTGQTPSHTKHHFQELNLPTVFTLVLQNVLIFMQKIHTSNAPQPIINMFSSSNDIIPGTCYNYFNIAPTRLSCQTHSIFHEGPRLFNDILPELEQYFADKNHNTKVSQSYLKSTNNKPFKRNIKDYLIHVQGRGDVEEWEFNNFRLYKGSRSSTRNKNNCISRTNCTETNILRRNCLADLLEDE